MAKTIQLAHKDHGIVIVDEAAYNSDGKDGHGWSKPECDARGFKRLEEPKAEGEKKPKGDEKKTEK